MSVEALETHSLEEAPEDEQQEEEVIYDDDPSGADDEHLFEDSQPCPKSYEVPAAAFLPPVEELQAIEDYCDPLQMQAVACVVRKSKPLSEAALPALRRRVQDLGFTEEQLETCLRYIRDLAPIVIHVFLDRDDRLGMMLSDTHYRNQFETGTSKGWLQTKDTARMDWEDRLFDGLYHSAAPFQRPKYGVVNILKDGVGVRAAYQYGDSYLVLKRARLRCSFSDQDSSAKDCELSSCENYAHVLLKYSDSELKGVMMVANGFVKSLPSVKVTKYKEVQIHGALPLDGCVEALMVNPRHQSNVRIMEDVQRFCAKNHCVYEVFEQ